MSEVTPIWAQCVSVFHNAHKEGYTKIWIEDGKDGNLHYVDIFCENEKGKLQHYGYTTSEANHSDINAIVRFQLNRFIIATNDRKKYKTFRVSNTKTVDDPPYVNGKNTKHALQNYIGFIDVARVKASKGKWCVQQVDPITTENIGKKVWYEEV